jgi:hypothetical protein
MFVGEEYSRTVDYLVERLNALCQGQEVPKIVILEAESGSGKSRIVKEFYNQIRLDTRFQDLNSKGESYWPHLESALIFDDYETPEAVHRKTVSPNHKTHTRPEETFPGFMWESIRCDVLASQPALHFGEIVLPSFEAHLPYLAYSWQKKALSKEKFSRWVKSKFSRDALKEIEEASGVEALLKALELLEIPVFPGVSFIIEKIGNAISHGVEKGKIRKEIREGGQLAGNRDYATTLFTEISRLIRHDLPLVIAVEDIHLMTEEVSDFLLMLAALDKSRPVLIVGTSWPEARHRPIFKGFVEVLRASESVEFISNNSQVNFPELNHPDRIQIAKEYAPHTSNEILEFIADRWANPLAIKLIMSSDFVTRRIKNGALVAEKEQLNKMPIGVERIFEERWLSLDRSVRGLLSICAGGIPHHLMKNSATFPFVSSVIVDVIQRLNISDPGHDPESFEQVKNDALWLKRAFDCLDSIEFREWFIQKLARESFDSDFDKDFEAKLKSEILRLLGLRLGETFGAIEPFEIGSQDDQVACQWYVDLVADLPPSEKFALYKSGAKNYDRALELLADKAFRFRRFDAVIEYMSKRFRAETKFDEDLVPYLAMFANICSLMGRYDEAVEKYQWWLDNEISKDGEASDSFFGVSYNMARLKRVAKRPLEALDDFDRLIEMTSRLRPGNTLMLLGPRAERAVLLAEMEKFDEAIPELESLAVEFEHHFGKDDGRTIVLLGDLENAKSRAGIAQRTVESATSRLEQVERTFGKDHEYTYGEKSILAMELSGQRHFEEALTIQSDVVRYFGEKFPASYPPAIRARKSLYFIQVRSGLQEEGLSSLVDLLEETKELFGSKENDLIAEVAIEAAWAAGYGQDLRLRSYLLHQVTEYLSNQALQALPYLRFQLENLAIFLGSIGDPSSLNYFETLLAGIESQYGKDSDEYFRTQLEKASAASTLGLAELAAEIFKSSIEAVAAGTRTLDAEATLSMKIDLAKATAELGKFAESVGLLEAVINSPGFSQSARKNRHNAYAQLVLVYENLGKTKSALLICARVVRECGNANDRTSENYVWFQLHALLNDESYHAPDVYFRLAKVAEKRLGPYETTTLHVYQAYGKRLGTRQFQKAHDIFDLVFERWSTLSGVGSNGALENRCQLTELLVDHGQSDRALDLIFEAVIDAEGSELSPWIEMRALKLLVTLADQLGKREKLDIQRSRLANLSEKFESELKA